MSPLGQNRKSMTATRMSGVGGRADLIFGRLDNDQRDTSLRGTPFLENRAFVIKLTRLFRF